MITAGEYRIKIAELFRVDANTIIYGPPIEEYQKRNRSWAIGIGIFLVVLFIADFLLNGFLQAGATKTCKQFTI